MSFIIFMICMLFAIFAGMVLDRLLIKSNVKPCEHSNLIFDNKEEVEALMKSLQNFCEDNGLVRVYDLNLLTGVGTKREDINFGWDDISGFKMSENDKGYILLVPKPKLLEK